MTPIDPAQPFIGSVWCDVLPRRAACPRLPDTVLLHAGPPFDGEPPAPVRNAAVQALLFERMAHDQRDALHLLASGSVQLQPAQDHGVATPLAQVVSASMNLVAVRQGTQLGFAAMLEGAPPALRFGSIDSACRERLSRLGRLVTEHVRSLLHAAPLPLAGIIREAVAGGDDCHSRTSVAHRALLRLLAGVSGSAIEANAATAIAALVDLPAFVLPIFMAASIAALRHHECAVGGLGGNGVDFGMRRRGARHWVRQPAVAPTGERFPGQEGCTVLPAIGDSVLVDFCGLGGQVDEPTVRDALRDPTTGILDIVRIAASPLTPVFNLAMLDAAGVAGLLGRGTYRPALARVT